MKPPPAITIPGDARKTALASLQRYADEELDLDIGDLKAALLLDYILAEFGPTLYNQGIADARGFFEERIADLDAASHREEFPWWGSARRKP